MPLVPRIELAEAQSPTDIWTDLSENLSVVKAGRLAAFTIDRSAAELMLGQDFTGNMATLAGATSFGSFPTYHEHNPDRRPEVAEAARYCFGAINRLIGRSPKGRHVQIFKDRPILGLDGKLKEIAHRDRFEGISVHVQGRVIENRHRNLKIGLRGPDGEDKVTGLTSIEDAVTHPTVWEGNISEGDVTILNSGLTLPDGTYAQSVHQFRTDYADAAPMQEVQSYAQFIDTA